jgi:hypothetical protein
VTDSTEQLRDRLHRLVVRELEFYESNPDTRVPSAFLNNACRLLKLAAERPAHASPKDERRERDLMNRIGGDVKLGPLPPIDTEHDDAATA